MWLSRSKTNYSRATELHQQNGAIISMTDAPCKTDQHANWETATTNKHDRPEHASKPYGANGWTPSLWSSLCVCKTLYQHAGSSKPLYGIQNLCGCNGIGCGCLLHPFCQDGLVKPAGLDFRRAGHLCSAALLEGHEVHAPLDGAYLAITTHDAEIWGSNVIAHQDVDELLELRHRRLVRSVANPASLQGVAIDFFVSCPIIRFQVLCCCWGAWPERLS